MVFWSFTFCFIVIWQVDYLQYVHYYYIHKALNKG